MVQVEYVPAHIYLDLLDYLFPKQDEILQKDDSLKLYLFIYAGIGINNGDLHAALSLFILPWLLQPTDIRGNLNLVPPDNQLSATICKSVGRIKLALNSFYIFAAASLSILTWCLLRWIESVGKPRPPLSSLAEIDFSEKVIGGGNANRANNIAIFSSLRTVKEDGIIRDFEGIQLYVDLYNQQNSEIYEMNVK